MLIAFLGIRGTVPDAKEGTTSILIDNKFLFDVGSEIISCFERLRDRWKSEVSDILGQRVLSKYGHPTFSKLEHIFLTHLHYDHWIGLPHLLHRAQMLEYDYRIQKPYQIYAPEKSVNRLVNLLETIFGPQVFQFAKIHPVSPGQKILIDDNYTITAVATKHEVLLPKVHRDELKQTIEINWGEGESGKSYGFLIEHIKEKLNQVKADELGVNSGKKLGRIRRNGFLVTNENRIFKSEIFTTCKTSVVYTGDTPLDHDLLKFCNSADIIIHETSYLDYNEKYHLHNHSSLIQVISEMNHLYKDPKIIIPIHFSRRFSTQDIEVQLQLLQKNTHLKLLKPFTGMVVIIEDKKMQFH